MSGSGLGGGDLATEMEPTLQYGEAKASMRRRQVSSKGAVAARLDGVSASAGIGKNLFSLGKQGPFG